MAIRDWEDYGPIKRLPVPGGWLYASAYDTLVFVPEPQGEKVPADELAWGILYAEVAALLPDDGIIDDSASLVNEIIELIRVKAGWR